MEGDLYERDGTCRVGGMTTPPPTIRYLTPGEYADLHHVSTHTVTRWVREGRITGVKKTAGGHHRFPHPDDVHLIPVAPDGKVAGHALQRGGGPHDVHGAPVSKNPWGGRYHGIAGFSTDGPGRALCECGALSDPAPSRRQRRAWHRQHKADVLAGRA